MPTDRLTTQANITAQWETDLRQATAGPDAEHLARAYYTGARALLLLVKRIANDLSPDDGAQALAALYAALGVLTGEQPADPGSHREPERAIHVGLYL